MGHRQRKGAGQGQRVEKGDKQSTIPLSVVYHTILITRDHKQISSKKQKH